MTAQPLKPTVAFCEEMYWIKCDDGIHWTPLDVADRIALAERIHTKYVLYAYLFNKDGTIFYGPPRYVPEQ